MEKIRVYELARELGITSTELRAHLAEMGVQASSASSSLDDTTTAAIRGLLSQKAAPAEAAAAEEEDTEGLEPVTLAPDATVKDFAQALDTDVENVLDELERLGHPHHPNQIFDAALARQVAHGWGYRVIYQAKAPPAPPVAPPTPVKPEKEKDAAPVAPRVVIIEREPEGERIGERRMKPPPPPARTPTPAPQPAARQPAVAPEPEPVIEEAPPAPVVWRPEVPADAPPRPPVVTVMGHVDHGKTTLLDRIRSANVTAKEHGGITQHIGAYQVELDDRKITFIDTPGHEAFTTIRARGARVTDIAILVVGADDGVKPQTLEAIDHARAADVPIIVAINKIDRAEANIGRVRDQLLRVGLIASDLGGDIEMIPVSALDGTGVAGLLETVLALADLLELKAAVDRPSAGTIIESLLDRRKGPLASIIVQEGVLHVGDAIVAGLSSGKVRMMSDYLGRAIREAGPSTPVSISGLTPVPQAGDIFHVVSTEKAARVIGEERRLAQREAQFKPTARASLQDIYRQIEAGEVKELNLVLKADTQGSIDAIAQSLTTFQHAEVKVSLLHSAIGEVTESDVLLAAASNGIIVGFQVGVDIQAKRSAADENVEIRVYQIIYDVIDEVRQALVGMLPVQFEETVLGQAEIRALFRSSKMGTVAGCFVPSGRMLQGSQIRVRRGGDIVYTGRLDSLRHEKEEVREIAAGTECGIAVRGYNDFRVGDVVEAFAIQEVHRQVL